MYKPSVHCMFYSLDFAIVVIVIQFWGRHDMMIGYLDPEGILTTYSPGVYDIGGWLLKTSMLRRKRKIPELCSETHANPACRKLSS